MSRHRRQQVRRARRFRERSRRVFSPATAAALKGILEHIVSRGKWEFFGDHPLLEDL